MKKLLTLVLLLVSGVAQAAVGDLHTAVQTACGCIVVSIKLNGQPSNPAAWTATYDASATPAQIALGNAAMLAFPVAQVTGAQADPLASLQAALIAKGVIAQTDINAAATSSPVPAPKPASGVIPATPVP